MNIRTIFQPLLKKGFQKISEIVNTFISSTEKGAVNGVATLDSSGKVTASQLPDWLLGQMKRQGLWDAATNTPILPNTPTPEMAGYYYIVNVAGTFNGHYYEVGDWLVENGGTWGWVDNTDAVSSVFGRPGHVQADAGDYAAFYASLALANTFEQKQTAPQFESSIPTGTPPLIVSSETEVPLLTVARATRILNNNFPDLLANPTIAGLHSFTTTSGALNTPPAAGSVVGSGFRFCRVPNGNSLSDWIIWRNGGNTNQSEIWVRLKTSTTTWGDWFQLFHSGNHSRSLITVSTTEPASPQDGDIWIVP